MQADFSISSPDFWRDRRVFITGATGVVGGHLTRTLIESGANVVALVRDWSPDALFARDELFRRVTLVHGDIRDFELLSRTLAEHEIQTVFHLAAQTLVGVGQQSPLLTLETNVAATYRLLEAARLLNPAPHVVLASSDKAYGDAPTLPYSEEMRLEGRQPYAVSKSCADLIAQTYAGSYNLPVAITRCGNIYGPGDLNWNRIVPGTIRSALRGERPIIRSDGTMKRDYLFVGDAVSAYVHVGEALASDQEIGGQAFNFGPGEPTSVLELVELILRACDRSDIEPDVRNEAKHEIQDQWLDATRAHEILGWKPQFDLESGLRATVVWYRDVLKAASL